MFLSNSLIIPQSFDMADELTIKVVSGTSENLHVRVDLALASVLTLKQQIEQQNAQRFPISAQRLIFQGQILQDDKMLTDYHVSAGCALHLTITPGAVAAANRQAAGLAPPSQLRTFLQQMRDNESHDQYATAARTLQKICANIVGHPNEDKYRKLRVDNAALKAKLFDRTRGQDSVKLLGFQDGVQAGHLVLTPTPEKWEILVACKAVVDSVVTSLGGAAPAAASSFGAPSMGGLGGDFASQAQTLLQNPAMLQSMATNPMVQQMAQQNPMLAQALQNPALLAQSMQALQQNPAMMQQMNQMMSDPNAMAHMQQMMAGGMGGMGGLGGFGGSPFASAAPSPAAVNPFAAGSGVANPFASAPTPAAPAPTPFPGTASASAAASSAPTSSSAAATSTDNGDEEDEIAQAIARSLQDQ
ncbi:PUB domain-containing protein [Phytophthora infestans]|uniref:PUB domain-containing protein n=1 Tax=Phytophthora infestans TaxID=4787 RepID=A0A833SQ06_PHYIN|nr:PUB domain-containing protein [Phytophthora infestans]